MSRNPRIKVITKSPAEWFAENKQIAGFDSPSRALYTSLREFIENALDAAESIGVLPEVKVRLRKLTKDELEELGVASNRVKGEYFELIVKDNGMGMAYDDIPLLLGKVLVGTKFAVIQHRGRFGLGGKMALIYAEMETGSPAEVFSARPNDKIVSHFVLKIDLRKNEPIIYVRERLPKSQFVDPWWNEKLEHGTIIRVITYGSWTGARNFVYKYLRLLATITPYATIVFEGPDVKKIFERVIDKMPPPPKISKPHPQGIDLATLRSLLEKTNAKTLKEFLTMEFQRVGPKTAENFCKYTGLDPNTPINKLKSNEKLLVKIVSAAKSYNFLPPDASCLSSLGEDLLLEGVKAIFKPEWCSAVQRKPFSIEGHPVIVEAALAYGGNVPRGIRLFRFTNRIPLLFKEKEDVAWKALESINLSNYGIKKDEAQLAFFVSIVSTKIPYSESSKDLVSPIPKLKQEIELAFRELLRRLKMYLSYKQKKRLREETKSILLRHASIFARSLSNILKTDLILKLREDQIFPILVDLIDAVVEEE